MESKQELEQGQRATHSDISKIHDIIDKSIDLLSYGVLKDSLSVRSSKHNTPKDKQYIIEEVSLKNDDRVELGQETQENAGSLLHIERSVYACQSCSLHLSRSKAVPGMGVEKPLVLICGEAPGENEDREGLPFVGASGQYLDKWLEAIGLSRRTNVYITNTIKCRPPNNRNPHPQEIQACNAYLLSQIKILSPKLILALGKIAGNILTGGQESRINDMRNANFDYLGIPLFVTYHPSAVLRNKDELRPLVWNDLKKIGAKLESIVPDYRMPSS